MPVAAAIREGSAIMKKMNMLRSITVMPVILIVGILTMGVLTVGMPSSAFCAELSGRISTPQGDPIGSIWVSLNDSQGNTVRSALTDDRGSFDMKGVAPGEYDLELTPVTGGWLGGIVTIQVPQHGMRLNWWVGAAHAHMVSRNKRCRVA
jgi:Carboxypeptidase regulatory-like domain